MAALKMMSTGGPFSGIFGKLFERIRANQQKPAEAAKPPMAGEQEQMPGPLRRRGMAANMLAGEQPAAAVKRKTLLGE